MADNRITFTFEINDKGKIKVDGITKSFTSLDTAINKVSADLKKQQTALAGASQGHQNMISDAGLAGATLTELGRTVSDANFGIRGMANNLSQLSTLFITLVSKRGGGIRGVSLAFRQLGRQLLGPLGIILAFQSLIALLENFAINSNKAKESAEDLTDTFAGQLKTLDALQRTSAGIFGEEKGLLTVGGKRTKALRQEFKEFDKAVVALDKNGKLNNKTLTETFFEFQRLIETRQRIAKIDEEIKPLEEDRAKNQKQINNLIIERIKLGAAEADLEQALFEIAKKQKPENREKTKLLGEELQAEKELVRFRSTHLEAPVLTEDQEKALELLRAGNKARLEEMRDYFSNLNLLRSEDTNNTELSEEAKMRAVRNTGAAFEAVGDLLQEVAEGNKGLAITGVIVEKVGAIAKIIANTAIANTKAIAAFPFTKGQPFVGINTATAGISIAATTAAAVKAISGIKSGQDTDIKQSAQSAGSRGAPTFNVVGASGVDQIGQVIAQGRNQPLKAYVVGSEVTNQQDLDNKIINSASIG